MDDVNERILELEYQLGNLTATLDHDMQIRDQNSDVSFIITMGILIFIMQAGFAFLEAGAVRSKNTTNILIKNMLDPCFSAAAYWVCGWAFAYGTPSNSVIGYGEFCSVHMPVEKFHTWFFQFAFAATAPTIVSGSVAERCEFVAYVVYCLVLTGFLYPMVTHWAWAENGWLKNIGGNGFGFQDFAGSGVVHLTGGTCALIGAIMLGPRIGRFPSTKDSRYHEIRGHSVPFAALGGFILLFGFLAFNGGSRGSISKPGDGDAVARAVMNTIISGAFAAFSALLAAKFQLKKWSLLLTTNGALTGMVAICASCNVVHPWSAAVIGAVAGAAYTAWSNIILKLKIDDPLDAFAVHFGGGFWGVLATPIFDYDHGIVFFWTQRSFMAFAWNLIGGLVIAAWSAGICTIMFGTLRLIKHLRVPEEVEIKGLDILKHGEPAYPVVSYGHGWGAPWDVAINWALMALKKAGKIEVDPEALLAINRNLGYPTGRSMGENAEMDWQQQQTPTSSVGRRSHDWPLEGRRRNTPNVITPVGLRRSPQNGVAPATSGYRQFY